MGLAHWAQKVLEEGDKVGHDFDPDSVHDLRVALRRCRSMADGFIAIDPDPGWRQRKKLGKILFSRLGELRDAQVMVEWVGRLGEPEDPVRKGLGNHRPPAFVSASLRSGRKYESATNTKMKNETRTSTNASGTEAT